MAETVPTQAAGARREILTPEGVPLPFELAERGERAAALIVDLLAILGILIGSGLLVFFLNGNRFTLWTFSALILISFGLRSFYFIAFELRWQGRTPGKRLFGLRVIDRAGGHLRADAVFARNLTREVELFIPMTMLIGARSFGISGWEFLLTATWIGIFVLMPFFNRDRLRVGDIVAGTWVVTTPKTVLLPDIAAGAAIGEGTAGSAVYQFSREQLDAYGILELQTLEDVLRDEGPNAASMIDAVFERIREKIGWPESQPVEHRRVFLEDFYAAMRGRLETKMLFGVRRRDKHDDA